MIFGLRSRSQNLRIEDAYDRKRHWVSRRGWLSWGDPEQWPAPTITWQFTAKKPVHPLGLDLEFSKNERYISYTCYLWPFALYLTFETKLAKRISFWLGRKHGWGWEREIRILVAHEGGGTIRWNFWTPSMEWSSKTPKYRNGSFCPIDFIFGRWTYLPHVVSESPVSIPMPEGDYPGTVTMRSDRWERKRFRLWSRTVSRAEIEVKNPPEFAGKGENSWDCDDDAIFSMTTPATSVEDAIDKYRESVLRERSRHGNPSSFPDLVGAAD